MDYFKKDWKKIQQTDLNVRRILFNYPLDETMLYQDWRGIYVSRGNPFWGEERQIPAPLPPNPPQPPQSVPFSRYDRWPDRFANKDLMYSEQSPWVMKSHINLPLYTNPTNIPFSKMTYRAYKNPKKWESSVKWKSAPKINK